MNSPTSSDIFRFSSDLEHTAVLVLTQSEYCLCIFYLHCACIWCRLGIHASAYFMNFMPCFALFYALFYLYFMPYFTYCVSHFTCTHFTLTSFL